MFSFQRWVWEIVQLSLLRVRKKPTPSIVPAGELSFHFHWGWGWGTYDTLAEISGKVAPGDSLPDPQFVTNAGLSLEIWGWAFACVYSCFVVLPLTLGAAAPSSGQRPKAAGLCHPESSDIDTISTGRFGLPPTQGKPRSVPLWCTLRRWDPRFLRSSVWVSVAFVPPPPHRFVCFSSNYRCRENRLTSWEQDKCSLWRIPGQDFKWNHMPEKNLILV